MFLIEMILLTGCKQDLGDNQISWIEWIHKLPFKMFDTISLYFTDFSRQRRLKYLSFSKQHGIVFFFSEKLPTNHSNFKCAGVKLRTDLKVLRLLFRFYIIT